MSIVIDDNIVGMWYAVTGEMDDFMMAVSRCDEGLQIIYRHRYYASLDPWDEKDRKSWHRMITSQKDEAKAIETAREMVGGVVAIAMKMGRVKSHGEIYEILRGDRTVEEFAAALRAAPFAHSKVHTVQ